MEMKRLTFLSIPLVVAASIVTFTSSQSIAAPVGISYRQIGLCKSYETAKETVHAPADQAFAIFKIEQIDNSSSSKFFYFDPAMFYVDQSTPAQKAGKVLESNRRLAAMDLRSEPKGASKPTEGQVAKGGKIEVNSFAVTLVDTRNPSGGPEAKQYDLALLYDDWSPEWQAYREGFVSSIVMTKTNPAGTNWSVTDACPPAELN
ncbi:hypothetical protein [Methylocapsa palsarum]|uniref:Uncharacterized protein n=1 Tax=Methylocapsa palsarum TaxID=1612308 RepID=A0A1I4BUW2_9HYPH|nr:hypothetical protein [Methylocapsa palsarum]SFK71721.1 hypothetical protein SAMN05444581_11658 [Methylocapsa palsarum]